MAFDLDTDVQIDRDDAGRVIEIRHIKKPYTAESAGLASASTEELIERYVQDVSEIYDITRESTESLKEVFSGVLVEEGARLKRSQEKSIGATRILEYQETYSGLPVWNATLRVTLAGDPPKIISSSSSIEKDIKIDQPKIRALRATLKAEPGSLKDALGVDSPAFSDFKVNSVRLVVYRYDLDERHEPGSVPVVDKDGRPLAASDEPTFALAPTLSLPDVAPTIEAGKYYTVRELLFSLTVPSWGALNWRALIEIETGSVLYLRAFTAGQNCCVFTTDPVSATGQPLNGGSPAAALDAARTLNVPLLGLAAPVNNQQPLTGEYVEVRDTDPPNVAPPVEGPPFSFCYSSVTDNFAASCAYYNHDAMFRTVNDFGFPVATYFDGSAFPVPVDHRGWNIVNAQAPGNASGNGIGRFRYGLAANGQPVSIACDPRVCWHEFGHALLWDHVGSPNFGWCHSAGDTLAVILNDPGSLAPDRFLTFPFIPGISSRRHDRNVASGWAWGGSRDDRQYGSEQILSTLMFRIYRVAGGDDPDINVRRFAAQYLAYLIIHGIGQLTTTTRDPRTYVNALMTADQTTIGFDGHPGGAWHKVIRWSFEQQGLYQAPGAPRPVTQAGAPPEVDVYIDDGRGGEYQPYQTDFSNTPGVWNRQASDSGTTHQTPAPGSTNHVYVRVQNRGMQTANNVRVRCYEGSLGTALTWPSQWQALSPSELSTGAIASGGSTVVGPFQWTPGAAGEASILASVSADGDVSNAETVNGALSSAHLALLDNNVVRRDMRAAVSIDPSPWLSLLLTDEVDLSPELFTLLDNS